MTIEEYKDWYYELHDKYEETSFAMLQRGLKTTLKKLKKASLENIEKDVKQLITYEDIFDIILSIHLVIGRAQADRMLKGIETNTLNLKARNPLFGEAFAKAVLAFLETFGGDKIVSIREEFIGAVIDYIIEKNKAGDSFVRTVRELQNTFGKETGLYRWQMQRIVRTETMSASNFASWEAMKSERLIVDKVWIATNDHRTRDGESKKEYDHLAMEGIVLPRETKFKVPNQDGTFDELMYPVDPNGAPGNTINCRCTIAPRPRRDKDGKLIFKPREAKAGFDPNQARQADGKWGSGVVTAYHGGRPNIDEFRIPINPDWRVGLWLSSDEKIASGYGGELYEFEINLDGFFEVDGAGKYYYSLDIPKEMSHITFFDKTIDTDTISEWAITKGYKGVVFKNVEEGGRNYGLSTVYSVFTKDSLNLKKPNKK